MGAQVGKVIFEYDEYEDRDSLKIHQNAFDFYQALTAIVDVIRMREKEWIGTDEAALQRIVDQIPYEKLSD